MRETCHQAQAGNLGVSSTSAVAYRNASSIASARPLFIPGSSGEYVSRVMFMLAWPTSSWTPFGCLPAMRRIVAHVWRSSVLTKERSKPRHWFPDACRQRAWQRPRHPLASCDLENEALVAHAVGGGATPGPRLGLDPESSRLL